MRDYLSEIEWDKSPPGPELPTDVVTATSAKYLEAYEQLTGAPLPGIGARSRMRRTNLRERLDELVADMIAGGIRMDEAVRVLEAHFLRHFLQQYNGNQSRAAEALGIHRNTLRNKMRRLRSALTSSNRGAALRAGWRWKP